MKTWQIITLTALAPAILAVTLLVNSVVTKPVALLNKATDTTNMLANYEWFYEAANTYKARVSQVSAHKELVSAETDKAELSRLRVELSTMKQSCRELVAKYEAKTGQLHVGYLKSNSLPESLNSKGCE